MKKFIRKHYQEFIALMLVIGFWGSLYGYQLYQTQQADAFRITHTYDFSANALDPPSPAASPTN